MPFVNSLLKFSNDYNLICKKIEEKRQLVVNNHLIISILLLEDRRFYKHVGFDWLSIARVIVKYIITFRIFGGASTIEQQLVRTIINRREITIRRKLREIIMAVFIAWKFPKSMILNTYMELAFLGENEIGFASASKALFNCEVNALSPAQCSFLACLLKYPRPRVISIKWSKKVEARFKYCQMLLIGRHAYNISKNLLSRRAT